MPAVISQFIKQMTFNDELETRKAIYLEGKYIPLSEVTFAQITNPKASVPNNYDFAQLPVQTQLKMLAEVKVKRKEKKATYGAT